ncbi:helix-turn-helix transcriptional regulator [Geomicrobium sp. JSM 1781026]|uniref:helix-turn-helix transcriptional regulator n=1 Tax=Geomicrobium sp. JSM 1781026 TaxID=3344580 RepID=UPI0035C0F9F6
MAEKTNKAGRLLDILRILNEEEKVTASVLAERFHVSERTIYRYMRELEEMGIHYVTNHHEGYQLVSTPNYPNRLLTMQEWVALTVFPIFQPGIAEDHPTYNSAIRKLKTLTNEDQQQMTNFREELGGRIRFHDQHGDPDRNHIMAAMIEAITENRVLDITYYTISRDTRTERKIHPYYIIPRGGHLYITAYCATREGFRIFRLDRIETIGVTKETFSISPDFNIDEYLENRWTIFADDEEATTFVVRFAADIARYVTEVQFYTETELEKQPDGALLLKTTIRSKKEFLRWVRGFGTDAQVLAPHDVRKQLAAEFKEQVDRYERKL